MALLPGSWRRVVVDGLAAYDIDVTVASIFPSPSPFNPSFLSSPYLPLPYYLIYATHMISLERK